MMQNKDQEFDLLVRSMMENAEEEVPSRVWEQCAAQLDRQSKRPVVLWRRWAVSLAAAAAVAAVAVTALLRVPEQPDAVAVVADTEPAPVEEGPDDSVVPPSIRDYVAQAPLVQQARPAETVPTEVSSRNIPVGQPAENAAGAAAEESAAIASENMPEITVTEPVDASATEQVEAAEPVAVPAEEKAEPADASRQEVASAGPDPFAIMEWEDSRKRQTSRLALGMGGEMLSNGNPAAKTGLNARRAMFIGTPTETRIDQTSNQSVFSVPLTLGLHVRYHFNDRWSLGSGLNWSMLARTFTGTYTEVQNGAVTRVISSDIHNTLHYIGIPLHAYFNIINNNRIAFYAFAGGTAEKGITNHYQLTASGETVHYSRSIDGVQLSIGAGFGVQFNLSRHLGLYLDPSIRYWFDCQQPTSIRTQQPLMMGFEAGLRFNL